MAIQTSIDHVDAEAQVNRSWQDNGVDRLTVGKTLCWEVILMKRYCA